MNKQPQYYPHRQRRTNIHGFFVLLGLLMVLFYEFGCSTPKSGCYGTRGMSGYGYCPSLKELRANKTTPYLYNLESGLICVLDMKGRVVCQRQTNPVKIILRTVTDYRGYTSVIYREGGKEYALDYLTPTEWAVFKHNSYYASND
jgi:hypothetical protein